MTRQMFLAHSLYVSPDLCSTPDSTASHAASTSIHSAGTTPLVHKQGLVYFRHRSLEKVLGLEDVVVRDSIDHGTGPDLVEGIVAGRSAPDTAFVELDVEEALPRRAFGLQAPVAAVSSAPCMAWFSLFFRRIANVA